MRRILLGAVLLLCLLLPAEAVSEELWDRVDVEELERQAGTVSDFRLTEAPELDEGLAALLEQGRDRLEQTVRQALRGGTLVLTVALFTALAETVCRATGAGGALARMVGALALTGAALGDISSLMELGRETVERLVDFDRVLIPAMTTAAAASGFMTGAASRQMAALLCVNLLLSLMKGVLIPLVYLYIAACTGAAAADHPGLGEIAAFVRWLVQTALKWLLILFTAYLSVSGVISGTADRAAAKLTRFAISGMVPVVGGILSDAADSVLAGAGLLRSAIGVFGTLTVLAFCLTPFLRLGVQYLLYRIASTLTAALTGGGLSSLMDQLGAAAGLILAMTGTAALLTLISVMVTTAGAIP